MKNQIVFQNIKDTDKRKYQRPEISVIKLDNEISLIMMSASPNSDPFETKLSYHFNINPFKI